jgi:hypothetical protein
MRRETGAEHSSCGRTGHLDEVGEAQGKQKWATLRDAFMYPLRLNALLQRAITRRRRASTPCGADGRNRLLKAQGAAKWPLDRVCLVPLSAWCSLPASPPPEHHAPRVLRPRLRLPRIRHLGQRNAHGVRVRRHLQEGVISRSHAQEYGLVARRHPVWARRGARTPRCRRCSQEPHMGRRCSLPPVPKACFSLLPYVAFSPCQ